MCLHTMHMFYMFQVFTVFLFTLQVLITFCSNTGTVFHREGSDVINWYSVSITLCTTKLFCRAPSLDPRPETCPVFWCFCFLKTSVIKLINTNLSGVQIRVYSTLDHIMVLRTIFSEDNYNVKRTWS